jgi:hypothetical protein
MREAARDDRTMKSIVIVRLPGFEELGRLFLHCTCRREAAWWARRKRGSWNALITHSVRPYTAAKEARQNVPRRLGGGH